MVCSNDNYRHMYPDIFLFFYYRNCRQNSRNKAPSLTSSRRSLMTLSRKLEVKARLRLNRRSKVSISPSSLIMSFLVMIWYCMLLSSCKCRTYIFFNSLWPSDAICWYRSGARLVQVMACWLMVPTHNLNQCSTVWTWQLLNRSYSQLITLIVSS